MPDGQIVAMGTLDGHLVVVVDHFHPGGSFWFREDYTWEGREGLKHKRMTDRQGRILMDNDQPAPYRAREDPGRTPPQYLPAGRDWKRHTHPHMDDDSILDVIRSIHRQRLLSGWTRVDRPLQPGQLRCKQEDRDGCNHLVTRFQHLLGQEFTA